MSGMSLSTTVLRATFETLHRSGAANMLRPWTQGLGVIFCMHRIQREQADAPSFAPNSNLSSTPEFLDAALLMLRQAGYEFLSLDAAAERIASGVTAKRPFAVFTLDDGYRDNLEQAMPVFLKHDCPFTVYVAPGFVDGTTEMWWMALERMIAGGAGQVLAVAGEHITLEASDESKWAAWSRLAPLVQALPEHEQRAWIQKNSAVHGIDLKKMCQDQFMTWDEVRQMAGHPLATIGAHTLNHYAVARLSEDEARTEILASGKRLQSELALPVKHFAFPYGNIGHAGPRDFQLSKEAGYVTAVTTRLGSVYPEHASHLHALPRIMVSGKYQETRWLKVLASGLPGRLKNLGQRLNVA